MRRRCEKTRRWDALDLFFEMLGQARPAHGDGRGSGELSATRRALSACSVEEDLLWNMRRGDDRRFVGNTQVCENRLDGVRLQNGGNDSSRRQADRRVCGGFMEPPQSEQARRSNPNTLARSCAQVFRRVGAGEAVPGGPVTDGDGSGAGGFLGTIWERILACGARQPKNLVRCIRGGGGRYPPRVEARAVLPPQQDA